METTNTQSIQSDQITGTKPFKSSWIDYLVNRIENLPGPPWVFYLGLFLVTGLLNNVALWVEGALKPGEFDTLFSFAAIYNIYGIGAYHHLTRVAANSLHDLYPALDNTKRKENELAYRMTNLPAGWGWLALIVGSTLGFFDAFGSQYDLSLSSKGIFIYFGIFEAFSYSSFIALMFLTARQLFRVIKLHRQVHDIDLFNLAPLRAFSRLTATAGFAVFFLGALSALVYSESTDPSLLVFYSGIVILGILIFFMPLLSMRNRINKEKKQKLLETDQRTRHILEEVKQSVQSGELSKMGELNTTLSVLEKEKSILKGISSYPWDPGTLKSFISTILLPLLLWLIRYLLEKWL